MRIAQLETRLTPVEAGVSNFRTFQLDTSKKISFVYGASKAAVWIVGIVLPLLIGVAAWFFTQMAYPAIKLILEDYYRRHPTAMIQREKRSDAKTLEYDARYSATHSDAEEIPMWQTDVK